MSPRHLKSLVEAGHYKPEPELIARAMLERRGFRAFLADGLAGPRTAGHSRPATAGGHHPS
jgi:hypothetical protein